MTPKKPEGFRFHYRHLTILVVFFAVFLGVLTPLARDLGAHGLLNPPLLLLLVAPWLLGILILIFERKSPVKFWAAPLLLSLTAPALAVCHDWMLVESWLRLQTMPNLVATLALNVALIGTFTLYATHMCPSHCPECRTWAMIPLRGFLGPAKRTPTTRWCASCGARYWRTKQGEWRTERRHTWTDITRTNASAANRLAGKHFNTDSRVLSPLLNSQSRITVMNKTPDPPAQTDPSEVRELPQPQAQTT